MTPQVRDDIRGLHTVYDATTSRIDNLTSRIDASTRAVASIEVHLPAVLNAISSTNGTSRLLARELGVLQDRVLKHETEGLEPHQTALAQTARDLNLRVDEAIRTLQAGDDSVRAELGPHIETLRWLLQRVETVRAEMMHELRYGRAPAATPTEPRVINARKLAEGDIRLNLGAGQIPLEDFINIDVRELPGIDVVASVDALPFERDTVTEIFSSHTVEHFPDLQLRRQLLPYWVGLLRNGGTFRAVVPDLQAMTKDFADGKTSFEKLRSVVYGGQEYEGDFHFTGFTPESLTALLLDAGLESPTILAQGRPNGDCLEFEIVATKPSS